MACGGAASAPSEEGAGAPEGYKGATEGEITRGRCLHRGADEHRVKKRSFAFSLAYIKCFRTYSVYLSLRLPAQILYAGIHLCPLAVLRSCFGYSLSHLRTAAACLSRCFRHWRRSKAKPLRGSRGGCRRAPQNLPQREPSGCRRFRRGAQIPAPCARRAHPCSRRAHPCSRRTYPCSRRKKSRAQNEHGTFGKNPIMRGALRRAFQAP